MSVSSPGQEPGRSSDPPDNPAKRNIQTIAALDRDAIEELALSDRVSAAISRFVGSLGFVIAHVLWFFVWAAWNLGLVPGVQPFDPFPFGLLTMAVSLEGVLVATFVLITQNWMNRQAERRAHLDLQVNILAEQEMTLMLKILREIADKVGAGEQPVEQVRQYEEVDVHQLASELDEHLPRE
jgi:uncharacterized membrane protein